MSDGCHLLCLTIYTAITAVVTLVRIRQACANLNNFVDRVVDVGATCVTIELVAFHQTLVAHDGCRDVEVRLFVTTLYGNLIVLRNTVLHEHIHPISIGFVIVDVQGLRTIYQ